MTDYNSNKPQWTEVDVLVEPTTKIGVRISHNRDTFNIQVIREFAPGKHGNYLPVSTKSEHNLEDVVYSLIKAARERIEEERSKDPPLLS